MAKEVSQERLRAFLLTFYSADPARDWVALMQKYLREEVTGDYNTRLQKLYVNAVA